MIFKNSLARMANATIALWLASVCLCPVCRADDSKPDVGLPSKWVIPVDFNPRARLPEMDPSVEMRWILKERQINAEINETFHHEVRQMLTPSGAQNGSHLSVDYDPTYQALTFHWVRVWRGTNFLNRLTPEKITVNQRGLDTDEFLFSTEKTATLLLDDVRVGDMVDYAYTIEGVNPALADGFSARITMQSGLPIDHLYARLLWPTNRLLYVQNHGTSVKYTAFRKAGGLIEFKWDRKNIPAWRDEPPLPAWYDPFPWVQLSEFAKWATVNQWALRMYTNTGPLSAELLRQINDWKRLPGAEQRVLAALRFVQDNIRYLGMEDGASGYKAESPSAVFAQRFGDCKGKSFLFVTILRAMGVEAYPALVNTRLLKTVAEQHPSATAFDHVITQVNLDGRVYWLDATANYQRGPLAVRSWPNYGYALVVRPGTTGLTPVPPSTYATKTTVTDYLTLRDLNQPSLLKIVTVAEGRDAEWLREKLATTSRDEIARDHLNYYSHFYHDIAPSDPLVFTDNEDLNAVEVDEFYSIRNIWSVPAGASYARCEVYAHNIADAMGEPALTMQRTMPLGVPYPEHEVFHAEVVVPPLSIVAPDEKTFENPAFYFHRALTVGEGKVYLSYDFHTLADAVPPDGVGAYVQQLRAAAALTSLAISSQ